MNTLLKKAGAHKNAIKETQSQQVFLVSSVGCA
jgi:hypothetical protein